MCLAAFDILLADNPLPPSSFHMLTHTVTHSYLYSCQVLLLPSLPNIYSSMNSLLMPTSPQQHKPNNTMSNFETTATIPFHHNVNHKRSRTKTPSFSSILLDAIYRSIDDTDNDTTTTTTTDTSHHPPTTMSIKHDNNNTHTQASSKQRRTKMRSDSTLETADLRHAIMIESWIEKQQEPPPPLPKQPPPYYYYYHNNNDNNNVDHDKMKIRRQKSVPSRSSRRILLSENNNNSSSTSGNFTPSPSSSSTCFTPSKIRTTDSCFHAPKARDRDSSSRIFTKTKSRALKIYSDLKKSNQQPISPGGRIAAFLNSIFRNSGGSPAKNPPSSTSTSACSSASSFSRSCLSKTTASTGKSKRSVRFYPVSVIVDEDSRPCGQKSLLCKDQSRNSDDNADDQKLLPAAKTAKAASDYHQQQRKWKREKEIDALMMMIKRNCSSQDSGYFKEVLSFESDCDEDMNVEDEDDGESCASSDLFELENLSSVGVSRFNQELPVYGTTSLKNLMV